MTCCFRGLGNVSMAKLSDFKKRKVGLVDIGNVSKIKMNVADKTDNGSYSGSTGNRTCATKTIDKTEISFTVTCFKAQNLAYSLFGDIQKQTTETGRKEAYAAYKGTVINLKRQVLDKSSIKVYEKGTTNQYIEGTDYYINNWGNGILIPLTSTIPQPTLTILGVGNENIEIEYNTAETILIGFANAVPPAIYMEVVGANIKADSAPFITRFFNCSISPTNEFTLISEEISELNITASLDEDVDMRRIYGGNSNFGNYMTYPDAD